MAIQTDKKKTVYYGIFWVLAESEKDIRLENLICIKQKYDDVFSEYADYTAKNSTAFNHERDWEIFQKNLRAKSLTIIIRAGVLKSKKEKLPSG